MLIFFNSMFEASKKSSYETLNFFNYLSKVEVNKKQKQTIEKAQTYENPLEHLPPEIIVQVLLFMPAEEIYADASVSKELYEFITKSPELADKLYKGRVLAAQKEIQNHAHFKKYSKLNSALEMLRTFVGQYQSFSSVYTEVNRLNPSAHFSPPKTNDKTYVELLKPYYDTAQSYLFKIGTIIDAGLDDKSHFSAILNKAKIIDTNKIDKKTEFYYFVKVLEFRYKQGIFDDAALVRPKNSASATMSSASNN